MTIAYTPQLTECCSTTTPLPADIYVMVESFGAAADGVTDDSDAFVRALADGRPIGLAANKSYALKNLIVAASAACPGIFAPGGQARIVAPPSYVAADWFFVVRKATGFVFDGLAFDMPVNANPAQEAIFNRAIWLQPEGSRGRSYRVENCSFSGGLNAVTGVGYIVEDSLFAGNYVTATKGDAFSFNAMINCRIVDNIFEDSGTANVTTPGATSGIIRTGTDDQLDTTLNLTISRNTITRCGVESSGSAIDCFSGAARNIRITDNILSYNGNGIELKTLAWDAPVPLPPGASDVYDDNVIASNTIRLFSDRSSTGISVHHATGPQAAKGKAANLGISGNIISATTPVAVGPYAHYGIAVAGHDQVSIDGNFIFNTGHGIAISGLGPVGDTADHVVVSNNTVDVSEIAVQHAGGTLNNLYIRDNPLLRAGAGSTGAAVFVTQPGTDIDISGNRIESLSNAALDIQAVSNCKVTDNTLIGATWGVLVRGTAVNGLKLRDNDVIAGSQSAVDVATGTAVQIQGNNTDVAIGSRSVTGAGSYTAADNNRGMRTAIPDATVGGALGDSFSDSTAATAGWRCTVAGAAGFATYVVI